MNLPRRGGTALGLMTGYTDMFKKCPGLDPSPSSSFAFGSQPHASRASEMSGCYSPK